MVAVKQLLEQHLGEEQESFVFPSEVAAEFWRREALKLGSRRAIWEDRFLSWDRFKEECFSLTQAAAPINRRMRMLFAADLLKRNGGERAIFSSLIRPEFADTSSSSLRAFTQILPELKRYRDLCRERGGNPDAPRGVDPATHADLNELWERYNAFLRDNGLFEPSYDRIDVSHLEGRYHVFFPEVIEDWREAAPFLDSRRIRPIETPPAPATAIERYDNSAQELRALFGEISRLLAGGVAPEEIAVTVPRLEAWESYLLREADLLDVPLDLRQGHALAEYTEVGLFARLADCVAGGFQFDSLKALFHCRAYPWRHRQAGERLIRWGIDHHCAGRYRAGGRMRDLWSERLSSAAAAGDADARSLGAFYSSFTREVTSLIGARSFAALRAQLQRFLTGWLDTELWKPESLRSFQFALDALGDLVEAERRVVGIEIVDPYSLWLAELRQRLYVSRSSSAGIPVYPYRVSAGIAPAHHFLVGATQGATQVEWSPLSFLREDERESLGAREIAATDEFLKLYLQSGSRVRCSFSAEDYLGVQLPPGYFVIGEAVERPGDPEGQRRADPYLRETELWASSGEGPSLLLRRQKEGAAFFRRAAREAKRVDATRAVLSDAAQHIRERLSDEVGRLKLSATRLESFRECPFAFLFATVLRAEEKSYAIDWSDPMKIGALMHEILRRVFEEIRMVDPGHLDEQRSLVAEMVDLVFEEWEERGEAFVPPVWGALRPHLVERLGSLLGVESQQFAGLAVEAVEQEYADSRDGIFLSGRIDRVSGDARGAVIIDYKRNSRVRAADLTGGSSHDEGEEVSRQAAPTSFQIPLYVRLLEAQGRRVCSAAYYDIEKARYHLVFDDGERKAWFDREKLDELLAGAGRAMEEMAGRVRRGDYRVPDPQSGCEECRLRPVCRMKYAVR